MKARRIGRLPPKNFCSAALGVGLLWAAAGGVAGCNQDKVLTPHTDCDQLASIPRRLWRLSAMQYGNAIKDLLGLDTAPTLSNNGGTSQYAFFSDDAAGVDSNFQFSIFQTVESTMAQIAPQIPTLAACKTGEDPTACAQRFAKTFGARAFRRPLGDDEVTALMGPFNAGMDQDFNTGISLMIEGLVQSPSFLFRTELGPPDAVGSTDTTTLTPYETATQLSFLFRDSIPDAPLMAAADNGSLATEQGIAKQVDRLLTLPEVKTNLNRIVGEWFNIRQVFSKTKTDDLLSTLPDDQRDQPGIQSDLYYSSQLFINNILWSGSRHITNLLTDPRVYVNQRLATLYGFPFTGSPDVFTPITPQDGMRAGMLTQPNVLWGLSNPSDTSIVKRGRFVHDDVICEDPAPSPGNLLSQPDIVALLATLPTEIDKSDYRLHNQPCEGCHSLIDPYARVLENFGPAGSFRTIADGLPVDPTADFTNSPLATPSITGEPTFVKVINDHELFTQCAVQKMSSYALGRMIRVNKTCQTLDLHDEFQQTDGSITSLFRKVATAAFLRPRAGGEP
jgi:hypothetical protein